MLMGGSPPTGQDDMPSWLKKHPCCRALGVKCHAHALKEHHHQIQHQHCNPVVDSTSLRHSQPPMAGGKENQKACKGKA
ncbi:hypothetical protein PCASD_26753 [Puccinia coronata f. sp. avenae]|uniref:Uncharacterized protein n=1 Tax=Puccinia coronata f. sp. avenae TaxID=200324 RepID=A0A2N5RW09_9BASI|nr:hypothetical protein PCASD_26753 [Puccinia coronata f. sp. avenae]